MPVRFTSLALASALLMAGIPVLAQETAATAPSPGEIVAAAPRSDWRSIGASDLLVMDLAPDRRGRARRVVIQLMPEPFSQSWISNIRRLAAAHWWDGLAITRVQDNYVVQWGDPNGEDAAKAKPLPSGVDRTVAADYTTSLERPIDLENAVKRVSGSLSAADGARLEEGLADTLFADRYASAHVFVGGWPLALDTAPGRAWPVHCYGMVGVGRNMSPDAGTGAELYTVIGHAPRHLDRNIALVGRVIEGIEHLSSLPRGTGPLGFYEMAEERTGITAIRLGTDVTALPTYEYLDTESASFARYLEARANRRDPFFITPTGGVDICNAPVPVRRVPAG